MESVSVYNDAEMFDKVVHGGPPEGGDLAFVVKQGAMKSGRAGVAVTFTCQLAGEVHQVQATTSLRALIAAIETLRACEQQNESRN